MLAAQSAFAFAFASEEISRCMLVVIHLNKVIGAENLLRCIPSQWEKLACP